MTTSPRKPAAGIGLAAPPASFPGGGGGNPAVPASSPGAGTDGPRIPVAGSQPGLAAGAPLPAPPAGRASADAGGGPAWAIPAPLQPQAPAGRSGDAAGRSAGTRRPRKPPLTGLELIADRMPEAKLESGVRDILKDLEKNGHKVLAFHPWSSKHSAGGWPDWAFCTVHAFMVRELKKQREKPRADQQEWLDSLTAAGVDADIWRPSDLLSGRIARELAALAGMGGNR
jgi:hypothetical protein